MSRVQTIVINPDFDRMPKTRLREYLKQLKYLLEEAETYNGCPTHAVQRIRDDIEDIKRRVKR